MAYRPSKLRLPSQQQPAAPGSDKRKRDDDDDSASPPPSTRRCLTSSSPESGESDESMLFILSSRPPDSPGSPTSPTPYPVPDDTSSLSSGKAPGTPASTVTDDREALTDEQVCEFHRKGTEYQEWIADPTLGGCRCGLSRRSLSDLFNNNNKREKFLCPENHFDNPPASIRDDLDELGFSTNTYRFRYTRLAVHGFDENGYKMESQYRQSFAKGVIISECIFRYTGPHWSSIAIAQYKFDHPIDTLKYLYFTNVQNNETLPYVQEILYPRHDVDWPKFSEIAKQVWEYGTDEYKEILGTKLGRAAARLVIGAWDRGTHRIARVFTLGREHNIHLRFDIEPIPTSETS
ncbi:hypothetical protein N7517_001038 [Penicillium concentricum]|uniref:Uncharacterized protein n=1 Tax=Penicillium concentricum TaxID=293559 RepID=A0A9W9VIG5_9EURO|nr:uncharacterized protein N7517_001038 [Penicillium concentricum]KAJ5383127.1 hypothetical protein N7517_001038 [Penicillium concentricum]